MKQKLNQPKLSRKNFPGVPVSKTVIRTLFFCSVILLAADVQLTAKHFNPVPDCTNPTITFATGGSVCGFGDITVSATASAGTINWYATATEGYPLHTGNSFPTFVSSTTTYYVDATDGSCTTPTRTAVTIIANPKPSFSSVTASPSPACEGNTILFNAVASGGNPPYTYSWTGPNGFSTTSSSSPAASNGPVTTAADGFYYVTVTDNNGCTGTSYVLDNVFTNPVFVTVGTPNPVCTGNTLTLTSGFNHGGSGAMVSYTWTGPNGFTASTENPPLDGATSAIAGIYSMTATDSHGCIGSGSTSVISVVDNTANLNVSGDVNVCPGSSANLTASGCASYDWFPSLGLSASSGDNVIASPGTTTTYVITGYAGNCKSTKNLTVSVLQQYLMAATASGSGDIQPTSINTCAGADQVYTVTPVTGYHIRDVQVDGVSIGHIPPFIVHNVTHPHTVTAAFDPDCTTPSITSVTSGAVCGSGTANLAAVASAGTINWYTSATGGTSLHSGNTYTPNVTTTTAYYVDATDGTCVSGRTAVTAAVNSIPTASVSVTNVSCYGGSTGAVTVTGAGGGGGYLVSGAATTGLSAGTYNYTITDANGCTANTTATVTQPSSAVTASASVTNVSCFGGNTGSVTVTGAGGAGGYTVTGSATTGLTAGTYNYTVTDINGCSANTSATVTQPSAAVTASVSVTNVSCFGGNTGRVAVTGAGGAGGYTVTGSATTGLTAGIYNYTVTDVNGCSAHTTATVTQPSSAVTASALVTNVSCFGGNSGSVTVTGAGGAGGYTVSGGATAGLPAGTYDYTVTDANGCSATTSATVSQPSSGVSASVSVTNVSCYGAHTGAVTVTGSGGSGGYSVSGSAITGLAAGTYNYTVTDANGCAASTQATVTQPSSAVAASVSVTNVSCYGDQTGAVIVTGSGGAGGYSVSGSATTGLAAGNYNYTVTDANGCQAATSATVTQPSSAVAASTSVTNVLCNGGHTGTVTVMGTGGAGGYSVSGSATTGLAAGTYNYTVTDANGCTATTSATVTQPAASVSATASVTNVSCYGAHTGAVSVTGTGGTGSLTVSGAATTGLAAGTYNYTVTDANGCTAATSATVAQPTSALAASTSVSNVLCNGGSTGSVTVSATGGTPSYSGTGTFSAKAAGTYNYTVTDANGCSATTSATVAQPGALTVSGTVTNVACNGQSNGSVSTTVSGGTQNYSYAWSTGATTSGISSRPAGTYTVTVTDAHSCTASNTFTITQPAVVTSTITGSSSTLGGTTNTYTGPAGMDSYSWSVSGAGASISGASNASTVSIASLCSTTAYTVTLTVTRYSSCSSTATLPVTVSASTTFNVYSCLYSTGSGNHPSTSKSTLPCSIKVFDRNTCGTRDFSQSHYASTWNGTTGIVSNTSISDPETVTVGGGPAYRYKVTVPANGSYLIIGQSTVSSSRYSGGSCTVYTGSKDGEHCSSDGDDDSDEESDGGCTTFDKYHSVIKDDHGKCNEGYTQQQHGSLMLIVSPAALDYTDTVELLPVVYESVEGTWDVSASAAPPSGFYSLPADSLSTSVADSEINAVQFSIVDTGSEWTNTKLTHNIFHKGAARVAYSNPKMINDRTNKPTMLYISPNPGTEQVNIVLSKFEGKATINIYNLLGQKLAEKPVNISSETPIPMDISSLAPGVYMVTAENTYGKATGRLVKSAK